MIDKLSECWVPAGRGRATVALPPACCAFTRACTPLRPLPPPLQTTTTGLLAVAPLSSRPRRQRPSSSSSRGRAAGGWCWRRPARWRACWARWSTMATTTRRATQYRCGVRRLSAAFCLPRCDAGEGSGCRCHCCQHVFRCSCTSLTLCCASTHPTLLQQRVCPSAAPPATDPVRHHSKSGFGRQAAPEAAAAVARRGHPSMLPLASTVALLGAAQSLVAPFRL